MPKKYVHITLPDGSEEQRGSLTRDYTHCVYTPGIRHGNALARVNHRFQMAKETKERYERKFEAIVSYQLGNKDALDFTERDDHWAYGKEYPTTVVEIARAYDGREEFNATWDHIGLYNPKYYDSLEDFFEKEKASCTFYMNMNITHMDNCKSAYDILMAGEAEVVGRDTYPGLPSEFHSMYPHVIGWSQSEKNAYKRRDTEAKQLSYDRSVWVMEAKPGKAKTKR